MYILTFLWLYYMNKIKELYLQESLYFEQNHKNVLFPQVVALNTLLL